MVACKKFPNVFSHLWFPFSRAETGGQKKRDWPNHEGYVEANITAKASLFCYAGDFQYKALQGGMTFNCV